jgi:predicted ArsR family transcriptional regulator
LSIPFYKKKIKNAENKLMTVNGQKFITISEMAKILKIEPNTVKQRLFQKGIKPLSKEALYDPTALKAIEEAPMGRPRKKPATPEAPKKPQKT